MKWKPIEEYDGESLANFAIEVEIIPSKKRHWSYVIGYQAYDSNELVSDEGDYLGWTIEDVTWFQYITSPPPTPTYNRG